MHSPLKMIVVLEGLLYLAGEDESRMATLRCINSGNKMAMQFIYVQGGWGGWPTGNGKKLSSSQAQLRKQHAWLLLNFFPFPVGHPPHPPCKDVILVCIFAMN